MRKRLLAGTALVLFTGTMLGGTADAKKFDPGAQSVVCGDGTISTVERIRNRNHKMRAVTLVYDEASDDGNTIGISVDAVTHEEEGSEKGSTKRREPDFTLGTPGTAVDTLGTPGAATTVQLRGERLAKPKDGRTYDLTVTCTDSGDPAIPAPVPVHVFIRVPHSNK